MTLGFIHTLGDSTLDNLFWMLPNLTLDQAKKNSVEGTLQELTKNDYEVISHAYDGFTTRSVLEGDRVGEVLPDYPEKIPYMQEKGSQTAVTYPLTELQTHVAANPSLPHYVVISVGGNDFRQNLYNWIQLLKEIPAIQKRYLQIVDKVKGMHDRNIKPILMFQYRTDANHDSYGIYPLFRTVGRVAIALHLICLGFLTAPLWALAGTVSSLVAGIAFFGGGLGLYFITKFVPLSVTKDVLLGKKVEMALFNALLRSFYKPILEYAKKEKIPILDLPNTFDPHRNLYESGIEPGKEGGRLIAEGIAHIVKQHDFKGESALYSKPNPNPTYTRKINIPAGWVVA